MSFNHSIICSSIYPFLDLKVTAFGSYMNCITDNKFYIVLLLAFYHFGGKKKSNSRNAKCCNCDTRCLFGGGEETAPSIPFKGPTGVVIVCHSFSGKVEAYPLFKEYIF